MLPQPSGPTCTYHKRVADQQHRDEQAMFSGKERLGDILEVPNARRACVMLDEGDKDVRGVHREAREREDDEKHAREDHRPAQLGLEPRAPLDKVVPAHTKQTDEDTYRTAVSD